MIGITEALEALAPNAIWSIVDGILTWDEGNKIPKPSDEEIKLKIEELKLEYKSQSYARLRKIEYDKLNQYELMYNDMINGTHTWTAAIYEIKSRYPKTR